MENINYITEALNLFSSNNYCATLDYEPFGEGFWSNPYIKVYDGSSFSTSKNCIRVRINNGECFHHRDTRSGKGGLPFDDNGFKVFLNYIMNKPCSKMPSKNVYEAIFIKIKEMYGLNEEQMKRCKPKDKPIDFVTDTYFTGKVISYRR